MRISSVKEFITFFNGIKQEKETFFHLGEVYFIRTVTHHYIGRLVRINRYGSELILVDAAWIADDGRFHDMMVSGDFNEVEPYLDGVEVLINRETIIDAIKWDKDIPRLQK